MQTPLQPVTIAQTYGLITDTNQGKYPHRTEMRDELRRALRFAGSTWGPDTPWETIGEADWVKLLEKRLEELLKKKTRAVRATEITMSRLITAASWLRKTK